MVTKEDLDKARAAACDAEAEADTYASYAVAAEDDANAAWAKYHKLKQEYENGK